MKSTYDPILDDGRERPLKPTERVSLGDDVLAQLRAAIQRGDFTPGEHLSEEGLAHQLRVSRGPVREALKQLDQEGLVVSQPNGRRYVARLTRQDVEEIFSLRMILERLAVQKACRAPDGPHDARMREIIDEMTASVAAGITEREAAELDLRIHDVLYEASGHKRLIEMWRILRPQVLVFLHARNASRLDFKEILVPYHTELVEAIAARDEQSATELIEQHIRSSYEPLIESYD